MLKVAPSILAADWTQLGAEVEAITSGGADWVHLDIMDGHYVPNITCGPHIVSAIRPLTALPLDVHLMIEPVDPFLEAFAAAGADQITIHPDAGPHTHRSLQTIRALGKRSGLALNPGASLTMIESLLDMIDILLIMTVNPGFGGQQFIPSQLAKIRQARKLCQAHNIDLVVDGGVTADNAGTIHQAGADVVIAGTAVFKSTSYQDAITAIRTSKPAP